MARLDNLDYEVNGVITNYEIVPEIAPLFNATTAYAAGDQVIHEGIRCKFTTAHPAGAWIGTDVEEMPTVAEELTSHGADITELKADFTQLDGKIAATQITNTASGAIASFPDGADNVPVKDLTVQIEPVQDLHGQSNPYPGGGGKNLLDPNIKLTAGTYYGLTLSTTDGYRYTLTGTATDSGSIQTSVVATEDAVILPAGTYYSKVGTLSLYKANGTWLRNQYSGVAFTVDEPFYIKNLYFEIVAGRVINDNNFLAIERGSTAPTAWSPYENICPISGWTGANVGKAGYYHRCMPTTDYPVGYAIGSANGVTLYYEGRGKYRVKGTATAQADISVPIYEFTTQPNTIDTRLLRLNNQKQSVLLIFYLGTSLLDSTTLSSAADRTMKYNVLADKTINRIVVRVASGDTVDCTFMPEFIDTAEEVTYNIDWTTEAGTVYGGTLDVTSGVLTVDKKSVTLDEDSNWSMFAEGKFFCPAITANEASSTTGGAGYLCNQYLVAGNGDTVSTQVVQDKRVYGQRQYGRFWVYDSAYSTLEAFQTALESNTLQIVYPLTTPITIQLDPVTIATLLGLNNIWADTGDTTVDYRADTKLYIENLTAPSEDDMVANTNIPSDTYFMIGNTLFLSTTTIPAGDTINPGTNCTLMNLASALNALNS